MIAHFQQSRYKANGRRIGRYLKTLESEVYCNSNEHNITGRQHYLEEVRRAERLESTEFGVKGYWNEFSKS